MNSNINGSGKLDVYQIVTDQTINLLSNGVIPWHKSWNYGGVPINAKSKRPYRGINLWLLLSLGFKQNLFLTWDQIKELGGSVNKGEKGQVIVYWTAAKSGEESRLRYYKVFNVCQTNGLPEEILTYPNPGPVPSLFESTEIITHMPKCPEIRHKHPDPSYHLSEDYINMPKKKSFGTPELYTATLYHQLIHSTGNEHRLNRKTVTDMAEFGADPYSQEELIAELGAAYLCSYAGIAPRVLENKVAYVNGWVEKFKTDKKFLIQASGQAQKAIDFILNHTAGEEESKEVVEHTDAAV